MHKYVKITQKETWRVGEGEENCRTQRIEKLGPLSSRLVRRAVP